MGFMDIVKGVGKTIYEATPFDNAYRAATEAFSPIYGGKPDWGKVGKESAIGAAEAALAIMGGGAGVKAAQAAAQTAGRKLTAREIAKASASGALSPGRLPAQYFPAGRVGRALATVGGPVGPIGAGVLLGLDKFADRFFGDDEAKATGVFGKSLGPLAAGTGAAGTGAAGTAGTAGVPGTGTVGTTGTTGTAGTGAAGTTGQARIPGGLVGLTPDQVEALAMQERELQRQYDELLNQFALNETQGRQQEAALRGAARREAAGSGQDLATQLAIAGLEESPAPAIAAEQIIGGRQRAQEAAAVRSLADLLAQLESGRTTAASELTKGRTTVAQRRKQAQIANTLAEQIRMYEMFGGL